jgi:hypothetical protein
MSATTSRPANRTRIEFTDAGLAGHYARSAPETSAGKAAKLDLHRYHYLLDLLQSFPCVTLADAIATAQLAVPGGTQP